ncbi:MAG: hypothetical protein AB7E79_13220 [Rhodospirillaceae bacterium]
MKSYRCVFSYSGGNTTINVTAEDGAHAITAAGNAITAGDYDRVEVWDDDVLVLVKTTPRAWDALGETRDAADGTDGRDPLASAQTALPPPPLPRRTPNAFAGGVRPSGAGSAHARRRVGL